MRIGFEGEDDDDDIIITRDAAPPATWRKKRAEESEKSLFNTVFEGSFVNREIGKGVDTWPPGWAWAHTRVSLLMTRVSSDKGPQYSGLGHC